MRSFPWKLIKFSVDGIPISQGSMKHIGQGRMIHAKAVELATWRALVAHGAKQAGCKPIASPISITMHFRLKRPKTVKREHPTVPPDLDKLARGVNDALTGQAYEDDSQIISLFATKRYSDTPGVDIQISDEFDAL
jgi:crossover junction endodeoxyribonuclease RusA